MDAPSSDLLRAGLVQAHHSSSFVLATEQGAKAIILDFGALDYMNSGGIGLLVTLLVRVQRGGQRLLAVGLNDHYRQISR